MKKTQEYIVCLGPVCVPEGQDSYAILKPPTRHRIRGCTIKYMVGPDFFHILDVNENIVFSAPYTSVLYCTVNESMPRLGVVGDLTDDEFTVDVPQDA